MALIFSVRQKGWSPEKRKIMESWKFEESSSLKESLWSTVRQVELRYKAGLVGTPESIFHTSENYTHTLGVDDTNINLLGCMIFPAGISSPKAGRRKETFVCTFYK